MISTIFTVAADRSGVSYWFPVKRTWFIDGLRLSEIGPIEYSVFPSLLHQTGSSFLLHMFVLNTWFTELIEFSDILQIGSIKKLDEL